jgi:hypothetical protein
MMPTISTAHYQRTVHAFVSVEHPDDYSEEQIRAALDAKALDIGPRLCFWANDATETELVGVAVGVDEPDMEGQTPINLVPDAPVEGAGIESPEMGD